MARPTHPVLAFLLGGGVGALGGLIGLGGAEFRLPALVGVLRFALREAVPVNLAASFAVLAAAFPLRASTVPFAELGPHAPAILGMLSGAMGAAFLGAGLVRRMSDRLLGRLILILLVALGCVLIGEGLLVQMPSRLIGEGLAVTVITAAAAGVVIGLVSSLLGVAGGELIIPTFILVFGADVKLAGSMSILVGLPTIAAGLLRHLGAGSVLRDGEAWRSTILPLGAGSLIGGAAGALVLGLVPSGALKVGLGLILIWSAFRVFRHLPKPADGGAAGALGELTAEVIGHDRAYGLVALDLAGQRLEVPAFEAAPGTRIRLYVDASDVTLALARPFSTSARNVLEAAVTEVTLGPGPAAARVLIDAAGARLAALVTRRSVDELGLAPGVRVFAAFKATATAVR